MTEVDQIAGLDGEKRQKVATGLWNAWRVERRPAAILCGFSGIGKSERIVHPLMAKAIAANIPTVHLDVPLHPTNLDQELMALLVEGLDDNGQHALAEEIRGQAGFAEGLRALFRHGALVVIDEFQRLLSPATSHPLEPLGSKLLKLARRTADGGALWLVSNREIDPSWTEPFYTAELHPPDDAADIERIVVEALGPEHAEERFPAARRAEVAQRLGANPRALRLLGHLLRMYSLEELLGPPGAVPVAPADLQLIEKMEQSLLAKAKEGLSSPATEILRALSVLRSDAPWELVEAIGSPLGEVRPLTAELRERYLLEIRRNRYHIHPVVREVEGPRLRSDQEAWRAIHLRAGQWYARPLLASHAERIGDTTLALALTGARYHLSDAQAPELLREALHNVGGYIVRKYDWYTPRVSSASELEARIALLALYLEEPGPPATEFCLANLLWFRGAPGDAEQALPHAERATDGQDFSPPWTLWVKLVREVQGLEAGVTAARRAIDEVAPDKNLFSLYQLLGAFLDHCGRAGEAVETLLAGAEHARGGEARLVEGAIFSAAADSDELLRKVGEWATKAGKYAPQADLADILSLERAGQWRKAAEAARALCKAHPTYLHATLHQALDWLGAGEPEQAREALDNYVNHLNQGLRLSSMWLSSLVALHCGKVPDASQLLAIYLGTTPPTSPEGIRATLLREWDHRVATIGEANPALEFPILPPTVTLLADNVVRTQHGPPVLPQHQATPTRPASSATEGGLRVLSVATEWDSGHGGLSTFNRQLCRALARAGAKVVCLVSKHTDEEQRDAQEITLVDATATPGMSEAAALARKPRLPADFTPEIIIGHGRITGPVAQVLADDHFSGAKRLHFIHMAPDEIEWFKPDRQDDAGMRAEERTQIELDLGRTAYRVVAVGPRLHNRFLADFSPYGISPIRFDPGFDAEIVKEQQPPPGAPWRILMLGRLEDANLKGLDLAARAVGLAASRRDQTATALELVVRGTPPAKSEELRNQLRTWSYNPSLSVVPRPYTTDTERLDADLQRASLVLMPSRTEGFGLVGLEAIVAGTPVLVGGTSGLGELLRELLETDQASRFVVPITGDDGADQETWARQIEAVFRDREAALKRAAELRSQLARQRTWAAAVAGLLAEVGEASGK